MAIDVMVAAALAMAIWKGYSRGFIVGLVSLVAMVIGLMAAIKLSAFVAAKIGTVIHVSDAWKPTIAFVLVFVIVVLSLRIIARALEQVVKGLMMGWANRLGGIILYALLYLIALSIVFFYADKIGIITQQAKDKSMLFPYIQPLGIVVIDNISRVVPFFKGMLQDLNSFFDGVGQKAAGIKQ